MKSRRGMDSPPAALFVVIWGTYTAQMVGAGTGAVNRGEGVQVAKLTAKQERFVQEYLVDLNATQSAVRAGYSERTADRIGPELLGKTCVSAAIQAAMAERARRIEITQDMVAHELAAIGFSQATDYAEVDGPIVTIKPTARMTKAQRAAIASIKQGNFGIEVKLHDKVKALELLGKHLGMFDGKGGGSEAGVQIIDDL